jgi:hypothetical protein
MNTETTDTKRQGSECKSRIPCLQEGSTARKFSRFSYENFVAKTLFRIFSSFPALEILISSATIHCCEANIFQHQQQNRGKE